MSIERTGEQEKKTKICLREIVAKKTRKKCISAAAVVRISRKTSILLVARGR